MTAQAKLTLNRKFREAYANTLSVPRRSDLASTSLKICGQVMNVLCFWNGTCDGISGKKKDNFYHFTTVRKNHRAWKVCFHFGHPRHNTSRNSMKEGVHSEMKTIFLTWTDLLFLVQDFSAKTVLFWQTTADEKKWVSSSMAVVSRLLLASPSCSFKANRLRLASRRSPRVMHIAYIQKHANKPAQLPETSIIKLTPPQKRLLPGPLFLGFSD